MAIVPESSVERQPAASLADTVRESLQAVVRGHYAIDGLIGQGGAAFVFKAREVDLDRAVAIKVLSPLTSEVAADRFQREARLIAQIQHPNVMPIYTVRDTGGFSFFTMPLVTGESLRALLTREGRLSIDEALRMLQETAAGLEACHQAGIVHRDVKPENILLEGTQRRVLLVDFGIARGLQSHERRVTQEGEVVGTPDYMSPEQATGDPAIDVRSDIYSLGVIGFEILTGRLPFEAASWHGMLLKQVSELAPRVEQFRHDCPKALGDFVARCLAKDPADRWQSMTEVRQALDRATLTQGLLPRWLRLLPVIGRRTPRGSMVGRFRRLAGAFVMLAVALFVLDLRDGALDFAPIVLLVLGFLMAAQYGSLASAGFSWRDLLPRRSREGRSVRGRKPRGPEAAS
jgi:serine/threonine protein kinase